MKNDIIAAERARNLRYKRPALQSAGFELIMAELEEIGVACDEVVYAVKVGIPEGFQVCGKAADRRRQNQRFWRGAVDWDLISNLIGDEDEANEFRMLFPDLAADAERLHEQLCECSGLLRDAGIEYDDCTVALLGDCYRYDYGLHLSGFDPYEVDYYALTSFESDIATSEAGKRLMRLTKSQMLGAISRSLRILMAYLDLRQRYDYLKASMDVLRGENVAQLKAAQDINQLYEAANAVGFDPFKPETRKLDSALALMPQRAWVE